MKRLVLFPVVVIGMTIPATGQVQKSPQTFDSTQPDESNSTLAPPTRTPVDPIDQFGQRQTRESVAKDTGIEPFGRINNRLQNRIDLRLRNRIDRNYNPQANVISPRVIADDQARAVETTRTER